mgnify:CR=1 FL=1
MSTTQPETTLGRAEIAAADSTDQLGDVLSIPEHLRDAMWKAESAGVSAWDSPGGLIVAGMGGSAIGGRLARAILGDQASRPVLSVGGYALPSWTTQDVTVLCASYSGDTEETLACFEAAGVLGAADILRPGEPLGFVHPLVRDAVYHELAVAQRGLEHARAAHVLDQIGGDDAVRDLTERFDGGLLQAPVVRLVHSVLL